MLIVPVERGAQKLVIIILPADHNYPCFKNKYISY